MWSGLMKCCMFSCMRRVPAGITAPISLASPLPRACLCVCDCSMILLIPFQGWVMGAMGRRRAAVNKATDSRVKMTNEALSGIRTLKQAGWEPAYTQVLEETRDKELGALWRMSLVGTISNVLMQVAPLIVGMVTLLVYSATPGAVFSAAKIFSALAVLNQLR